MKYGTVNDMKITNEDPSDDYYMYCVRVSLWVHREHLDALIDALTDEPFEKLLGKEGA